MPTSKKISLPRVRLSFARLIEPKAFEEGQDPRFEATFLLDPSTKQHAAVIKLIKTTAVEIGKEEWGSKWPEVKKKLIFNFGTADDDPDKNYDGWEGMFFVSTNKKAKDGRPLIVNKNGDPVQSGDEEFPYSGCYVNATITLWTNQWKKTSRVLCNLRAIKFAADGEPFSAAATPSADGSEFDEFEDDFGDDPLDDDDILD